MYTMYFSSFEIPYFIRLFCKTLTTLNAFNVLLETAYTDDAIDRICR